MTITTNAAELRQEDMPLYRQYPDREHPQPAFLELDPQARILWAGYSSDLEHSLPVAVWHRRNLRWPIPADLDGYTLAELLDQPELLELASRVCDGHSVKWDTSNYVGQLTLQAREAVRAMEVYLHRWQLDLPPMV